MLLDYQINLNSTYLKLFYLILGLDLPKHGEPAYPFISWGDGWGTMNEDVKQTGKLTNST